MGLIELCLVIAITGSFVWIVFKIPFRGPRAEYDISFPKIIIALVCFFMIIYILQRFGFNVPVMPVISLK